MEEILNKSPSRRRIESKLVQDELRLRELQCSLTKSEKLTKDMVKILDSFTSRLKKLDDTILPVYNDTESLTRLQENVEKSLDWMERVIGFYKVGEDVEERVREGPGGVIDNYLTVMHQVSEAMDHFHHFNPESMELEHLSDLFFYGREALFREFLHLLTKHSKPVHVAILHDIAVCEDVEDMPAITLLPNRVVTELHKMADYLVQMPGDNHTDIMMVYAQIRCSQLGRAMRSLMDTNPEQSLLSASIPKKSFGSSFLKVGHTPSRRNTGRKGGGGVGGGGGTGNLTSSSMSETSVSIAPASSVGVVGEETLEGCAGFMVASQVFLRLIQSEVLLMEGVVPSLHHAHVLDSLIKQPVDFFMSKGESLLSQAKKGVAHNDHSVVLSCLRLLRHVKALLPEYRSLLLDLESKPSDRFVHLLQQFDRLCSTALQEDFIQHIKGDSDKLSNLPKDGTVHSLTSNTMRFVDSLLEFSEFLGEIFQGQNSFSLGKGSTDVEKRKAVAHYLVGVLDTLNLNMDHKAKSFESPFLAGLFLLNNFQYILRSFTRNAKLLSLLEEPFADVEYHYSGLVLQQEVTYQKGFQKLNSFIAVPEVGLTNLSKGDKLSNQKRQLLKDKFKGFNMELEELVRVQQDWSVPDPVTRQRLRENNVEHIVPLYSKFYQLYSGYNFTKNPEKYLKYSPDDLQCKLLTFFDGGAK